MPASASSLTPNSSKQFPSSSSAYRSVVVSSVWKRKEAREKRHKKDEALLTRNLGQAASCAASAVHPASPILLWLQTILK